MCFRAVIAALILTTGGMVQAEDTSRGAKAPVASSLDKIKSRLEFHQSMVTKINNYLAEREKLASSERIESDQNFWMSIHRYREGKKKQEGMKMKKKTKKSAPPAENMNPYAN